MASIRLIRGNYIIDITMKPHRIRLNFGKDDKGAKDALAKLLFFKQRGSLAEFLKEVKCIRDKLEPNTVLRVRE